MYRATYVSPSNSNRWRESCARLLAPITLWLCVSVSLKYGYYGTFHMATGPSLSRLLTASSIFVEHIQVIDSAKKGAVLHGFEEKPELSLETNWNVSKKLVVGSNHQKGFPLWLNKGSRIQVRCEVPVGNSSNFLVVLSKGDLKFKRSLQSSTNSLALSYPIKDNGEEEYIIEEDDMYYIHLLNMNPRSIIMMLNVNVSSKMYDVTKAVSNCSAINGLCRLKLHFPRMKFVVLTTPNNGDLSGWYIELSFVARFITYIVILGVAAIFIFFLLKYLGACDGEASEDSTVEEAQVSETIPLMQEKRIQIYYGTSEEDPDSGIRGSSEDLYDGKICVICYDKQRNCFFVPCGHCATCYECAQRIFEGENKVCPICRRTIHKTSQQQRRRFDSVFRFTSVPLIRTVPLKGRSLVIREEFAVFISTKEIVVFHLHEVGLVCFLGI
ncbi:hypothetical protein NE237_024113 [Protea cynaroides]|uniref:RING-type domain-containing protein n=1 Tax=Protea cynaroides TaxID=273540 RepID=A0A9Q0K544_9MAGN|nr:hypothetical protein NE237_024113 [Protea cynaroides]